MNLRQLQYFVAVAEELHFGRAAERVAISQPPLSQQIIALEEELGVQLFVRTKRSVALTPAGRQWLPEVKQVLADVARLPEQARRLARGEAGNLTMAFVSIADYSVLPGLLRGFRRKYPGVQINLREATSDLQINALLHKEIDAGIVIPLRGAAFPEPLAYRRLCRERLIVAIPEDWLRTKRYRLSKGRLDFTAISHEPLIIFPRQSAPAFYDVVVDYYASQNATPNYGQEAIQMQTIISLVSAGIGIAWVPESLRNLQRTGVRYCELTGELPQIESGLLWRKDAMSAPLEKLIEVAQTIPDEAIRTTSF